MKNSISFYKKSFQSLQDCLEDTINKFEKEYSEIANIISEKIKAGNKILICGNGGSAAHAQHLAAEFLIRLNPNINRESLPALALTLDSSTMTACGNDYSFEEIFSRPLYALGKKNDILLLLSTSGNSKNLLKASSVAKNMGIITIGFAGGNGGKLKSSVEKFICFQSENVATIQESQILALHAIANYVEYQFLHQ